MIDLQRRVSQAEALAKQRLQLAARRVTVALRGHQHVGRERMEAARDFPDMQIVNLDDLRLSRKRLPDRLRVQSLRGRL